MLFRFYCIVIFFLFSNHFSYSIDKTNNNSSLNDQKPTRINSDEMIQDMIASELFEEDVTTHGDFLQIPNQLQTKMRNRCPNSYEKISSSIDDYNSHNKELERHSRDTSHEDGQLVQSHKKQILNNMVKALENITQGVKNCVKEIENDYSKLSKEFVPPLQVYNHDSVQKYNSSNYYNYFLITPDFVKNVETYLPDDNSKAGEMRKQVLAYKDFQGRCITGFFKGGGDPSLKISSLNCQFGWGRRACHMSYMQTVKKTELFTKLARFLQKEDAYCLPALKELRAFSQSKTFQDFIKLPSQCQKGDNEIESLKNAVSVSNQSSNVNTGMPDVMNFCKEEYEKTAQVCYCAEEDCSNKKEDSVLEKIHKNDLSICDKSLNPYLNICKNRANKCSTDCDKRLKVFKKTAKDFFFVKDLDPSNLNIHTVYKTECQSPIQDIYNNFKTSLSRFPYNRSDELKGKSLLDLKSFQSLCELPVKFLKTSYESLEEKCEEGEGVEKKTEKKKGLSLDKLLKAKGGWGASSSSQEDEIRRSYNNRASQGWNRDVEEFKYSRNSEFKEGEDFKSYTGAGSDHSRRAESGNSDDSNFESDEAYEDFKDDGYKKTGETPLSSVRNVAGAKGGLWSAPSRAWSAVKKKSKEMGEKADKRLRDYLLKDSNTLKSKNGYVMKGEEKRAGPAPRRVGLRSFPSKMREKAYSAYNNRFPISREEYRKRMGLMREDVDLAEVQDLMFYRFCYRMFGKGECDDPNDPAAKDRTLETVITRYNELAESQLITPQEKFAISQEQLQRQRRALTREQDLQRMINSLKESEKKAKTKRQEMGLSF